MCLESGLSTYKGQYENTQYSFQGHGSIMIQLRFAQSSRKLQFLKLQLLAAEQSEIQVAPGSDLLRFLTLFGRFSGAHETPESIPNRKTYEKLKYNERNQ